MYICFSMFLPSLNETYNSYILGGSADKSLARPGKEEATATKIGIYSTYSPRSSIHFLVRCSKFCKPLKKSERCPSNQVSATEMISASDEKWRNFNFFFQSTEQVVIRRWPDPENRMGDQDNRSPVRSVSPGLQVSDEPGHCCARTRPPW